MPFSIPLKRSDQEGIEKAKDYMNSHYLRHEETPLVVGH